MLGQQCVGILFRIGPCLANLVLAAAAGAQTPQTLSTPGDRPLLGSTFTAPVLAELPLGGNVYSLLETTQAELIADRFNSSGLNAGESARVGGFLGSWSQTSFRIGDFDVTDPVGSGAPLLFPEVVFWEQVDIATGPLSPDLVGSGLTVTLRPRRPTARWTTEAFASGSSGAFASPTPSGPAPTNRAP